MTGIKADVLRVANKDTRENTLHALSSAKLSYKSVYG
jgi:hypothetical protein